MIAHRLRLVDGTTTTKDVEEEVDGRCVKSPGRKSMGLATGSCRTWISAGLYILQILHVWSNAGVDRNDGYGMTLLQNDAGFRLGKPLHL